MKIILQNIFEEGFQKYGVILQKSFLKKKDFEIKNLETSFFFFFFICKTSHCQNLRAIKQIPFGLWLFIVSPSGEKLVSRKQRRKNFPASQTNATHKHSQLGSQITEPISAWKVYFRWLPGEISPRNLQSTLLVFRIAL